MKLFEKLFCKHKYVERYRTEHYDGGKLPDYIRITLICSECGKIKQIKI
jgi:hypothetical protein